MRYEASLVLSKFRLRVTLNCCVLRMRVYRTGWCSIG